MANSSNYRVQLRRRREGKTDYQARKALVISGRPRLVTRTSTKNSNAQIIIAKPIGDHTIAAANSRELVKKYGWKAPTGNIPAAYLTGLLCGLKAKAAGINHAILDIGLITPTKGAKIFTILHGVIDANVEIPHGDEKIVQHRAKGDHIAYYAQALQTEEEPPIYKAKFSKYITQGIAPENITEHFSQVRNNIIAAFKNAQVAPEPPSAPRPKPKPKPKPETKPTTTPPKPQTKPTPPPTTPKPQTTPTPTPPTTEQPLTQKETPPEQTPSEQTPIPETKEPQTETPKTEEPKTPKTEEPKTPKTKEPKTDEEEIKPKTKAAKEKEPEETEAPAKATKANAIPTKASTKTETAPAKTKAAKEKTPTKEKNSSKKKTPAKKAPAKAVAKTKKGEKKE